MTPLRSSSFAGQARILVPAGIGDIYWVLVKLRAFMAAHGIERPEVWIVDHPGRRRSLDYLRMVPWLSAGGYWAPQRLRSGFLARAFREGGPSILERRADFDWFLSFNGALEAGMSLAEAEPDLACEWYFDLRLSAEGRRFAEAFAARHGAYVVAAFFDHGWYGRSLAELPAAEIHRALRLVAQAAGCRIALVGAAWDREAGIVRDLLRLDRGRHLVDLTGRTSLDQYFALLAASRGCIGHPAGNTIKGTFFRIPTVLLWSDHFRAAFHRNACPPDSLGRWYRPINTRMTTPEAIAKAFLALTAPS